MTKTLTNKTTTTPRNKILSVTFQDKFITLFNLGRPYNYLHLFLKQR